MCNVLQVIGKATPGAKETSSLDFVEERQTICIGCLQGESGCRVRLMFTGGDRDFLVQDVNVVVAGGVFGRGEQGCAQKRGRLSAEHVTEVDVSQADQNDSLFAVGNENVRSEEGVAARKHGQVTSGSNRSTRVAQKVDVYRNWGGGEGDGVGNIIANVEDVLKRLGIAKPEGPRRILVMRQGGHSLDAMVGTLLR